MGGLISGPEELIKKKGLGHFALDPDFDFETFRRRLSGRKGEIEPVRRSQELMAGIGNVTRMKYCCRRGYIPGQPSKKLRPEFLPAERIA